MHTEGPWEWNNSDFCGLSGKGGSDVLLHLDYEGMHLAYKTDPKEREANAKLIAAAPDLLKALQGLVDGPAKMEDYAKARAAISKAVA